MQQSPEQVRRHVQESYARCAEAQAAPRAAGCCAPAPAGVAAKTAGYGAELAGLPPEAAASSFGCGNPLAFAEVEPGQTVLDLGSGAGLDLLIAARKVGPSGRAIGVDMTGAMIERARAAARAAGLDNVEVREGLIEALPVESGSVDWVISNCVINLSPEKRRVFAEIARVLRPGGRMLVTDLVAEELPEWVTSSAALHDSCVAGAISEAEYLAGLADAGLVDVEVRERLVYDERQLAEIARSEVGCSCALETAEAFLREAARAVAGKVWSARIHAQKPASTTA